MKRMTVVAGYQQSGQSETNCLVTVKGAPEVLREMVYLMIFYYWSNHQFTELPPNYDIHYKQLAQAGARIIALGIRELGQLSTQQIRETARHDFNCLL